MQDNAGPARFGILPPIVCKDMIVDLKDSSEIAVIAEPFFSRLNAAVEILPVMNADDLKKGLSKIT